jgi:hypothetical protein
MRFSAYDLVIEHPDAEVKARIILPWKRGKDNYMNSLETIFGELGISQYLSVFIEQGFDSWNTILDITESDL